MKLALCGPGYPLRGGIAETTSALAKALRSEGVELLFITTKPYPKLLYPGKENVDPEAASKVEGQVQMLGAFSPITWVKAAKTLKKFCPQCLILPYWSAVWVPCWKYLAAAVACPVVVVAHNLEDHEVGWVRRLLGNSLMRRANAIFTHGARMAREAAARFPKVSVAWHLLPPAPGRISRIDGGKMLLSKKEALKAVGLKLEEGERLALFFGLLRPYKGADLLVKAISLLGPSGGWRAAVVGEAWGGMDDELHRLAERLGVTGRVFFRFGWVPERELDAFLTAADICVFPFRKATQSASVARALAFGVPVLVPDVGSVGELASAWGCPPMLREASAEAVADALRRLSQEKLSSLRASMDPGGAPSWGGYARALMKLVQSVVRSSRGTFR